jgi:hypothetical protein
MIQVTKGQSGPRRGQRWRMNWIVTMKRENTRLLGGKLRRKLLLGTALLLVFSRSAGAVDWYTGEKSSDPDYAPSIVIDMSGSGTSTKSDFGNASVSAAIDGNMQQSGYRAHVEGMAGQYEYQTTIAPVAPAKVGTTIDVHARQENVGALAGYAWVSRDWTYAVYGGVEVINTTLSYSDPTNATKGVHIGGKIAGEFYGTPSKSTMLSGYASYSMANSQYYTRFKAGYSIMNAFYLGPELMALGNQFYTEYRAGIHLSGLKLGRLSLGLSGGALRNSVSGSGGYGLLDARVSF